MNDNYRNPTFLYVIGTECGPVKVGITRNLTSRLKALQTASPIKLVVLYFVMFDSRVHALEHERWFHDTLLPEERLCGEWCRLAAELAIESVETCMDYCAVGRCSYSLMNRM